MRRLFAVLLLAAFGLPVAAPAFALTDAPDANLPACCRRHGAHHCAMAATMERSKAPVVIAVCPHFPQPTTTAPSTTNFGAIVPPVTHAIARAILVTARQQAETARRIAHYRAHHKRGPPVFFV